MGHGERVIDREERSQVADILRPLEGGIQVARRGLRLTEIDPWGGVLIRC